jgi:hypothetical protein
VDPKGYYTCLLWTKTDMTFSLTKGRGFNRGRKRICPLWGHTQPPFQWIRKDLSLGVRGRGCKLRTAPHLRISDATPPLPHISSCHAPELCLINLRQLIFKIISKPTSRGKRNQLPLLSSPSPESIDPHV